MHDADARLVCVWPSLSPEIFVSSFLHRLGIVCLASAPALASAQNPAAIEHHLRYGVRLAGRPDTALDILDRMKSYHVPGVAVAVIDNWRVVYAKGFGVKQFGSTTPVDTTTLFLAGSISKPVFTSGFLRIVEEHKLSLDADVNTMLTSWHLPESKYTANGKVTLRRLLTHSAGLTVWGFPGYELGKPVPTVPQLLDGAPPANTPAVRNDTFPGARWLYSGGGITIAQLVATDVSHESLPALMQRLMLKQADMPHSTYENPLPVNRRHDAASGHEKIDTPVPGGFHVYPEMAAAGLWTTSPDLARWAIALAHSYRGERGGVLSTATARQMVSKQVVVKPPYGSGYWGLGIAVNGDGDSLQFSHDGRDEGFVAQMFMYPNLGRGLVILTNGVSGGLMTEIERSFAEEYGIGAAPRIDGKTIPMTDAKLAEYVGTYELVQKADTVTVDLTAMPDGQLSMYNRASRRRAPLVPVGSDAFINVESGQSWAFLRAAPGAVVRALAIGAGSGRQELVRK